MTITGGLAAEAAPAPMFNQTAPRAFAVRSWTTSCLNFREI